MLKYFNNICFYREVWNAVCQNDINWTYWCEILSQMSADFRKKLKGKPGPELQNRWYQYRSQIGREKDVLGYESYKEERKRKRKY